MYESPVVASLAESSNIAMFPALFLKQTGLLDQMRREILCEGDSLLQTDTTSASVRGNEVVTASINLMTQLYEQVDSSTSTRACAAATQAAGWAGRQDGRATGNLAAHLTNRCCACHCPYLSQPTRIHSRQWPIRWRWTASQWARSISQVRDVPHESASRGCCACCCCYLELALVLMSFFFRSSLFPPVARSCRHHRSDRRAG